ncbi:MAG: type IV pilus twitching motility protein PilT [Bdellovibrionia bacterium]
MLRMLKDWIRHAKETGASDLHLEGGIPMVLRVRGELHSMGEPLSPDLLLQEAKDLLNQSQWQEFLDRRSADLSQTIAGTRCRINIFQTVRGVGFAIRLLTSFRNSLRDCNLHPDLKNLIRSETGLLIVSGPTGSGKSTTLAALIEELNASSRKHILTIESPIEYFFSNRQSIIRQREVPTHTPSFEQAIVDSMREDPDVLVIGEMRTPDVMRLTLNAAETGHLVLATMHSSTCAEALARVCMSFPAEAQASVRAQLADCLIGVVCQRLTYQPQSQILVPHLEILVANSGVKSHIRTGAFGQIPTSLQTGANDGMWSFERYQRWIDQKRDWVKPSQATPLEDHKFAAPSLGSAVTRKTEIHSPSPLRTARPRPSTPSTPSAPSEDGRIEIDISDADFELEELGKRIAQKSSDNDSNK